MVLQITVRPPGVEAPVNDQTRGAPGGAADFDPWAAIVDEHALESGLVQRVKARRTKAAEQWLDDVAPAAAVPATPNTEIVANEPGSGGEPGVSAGETAAARTRRGVVSPARAQAEGAFGSRMMRDVARGATEAPRQILGGMRDATQAAINLGDWLGDNLEVIAPLGGFQLFNDKGEFAPERIPAGDPRLAPDKTGVTLPEVKKPTTVTGGVVRSVAQFLTGFAAAGGVIGGISTFPRAAVAGGLADFTAFDAHESRLSNLIEDVPALKNPVTEYLAAKPEDGEVEGRLKRAIEGLGVGAAAEGLFRSIRYLRDARRAVAAVDPEAQAARAAAKPPEAAPFTLLGDEQRGLLEQGGPLAREMPAPGSKGAAGGKKTSPRTPQGEGTPLEPSALTRDALTPLSEGEKGIYVNFAKIDTADDVKRIIAATVRASKDDIDAARRGVRSNEETLRAAGGVDAWETLLKRRPGEPLNAEEAVAVRNLWAASATKLMEVAEQAAAAPTLETLFQFRKMMAIFDAVQTQVIAARTETARALQSWSIPVGAGGAEKLRSIENLLVSHGGSEAALEMAKRVAALKHIPDGVTVLADVVEKGALATTLNVFKEIWINALLSNPKTHVVNIMGNFAATATNMIERAAAARLSQAVGSGEVQIGEAAAMAFAARQGVREGLRLFARALKTGDSQFGAQTTKTADAGFDRAISSTAMKLDPDAWLGKAADTLGFVVNGPTRFLTAEDDFFKAVGYRMELNAQAFRTASREVQDGALPREGLNARIADLTSNPPEHIRLAAADAAIYNTFTSKPGALVSKVNGLDREWMASSAPGGQIGSFLMRVIIPFRNTPANLIAYSFERTPLAPLMARYRDAIARGGADADIARARMALGTMALLGVMDLALDGHITGGGLRDQADRGTRDTLLRSGWQPYSVKLGDRYFSYKRTDPVGITLGIAADIAEIINNAKLDEDKRQDVLALVAAASASFANQILDKSYLSGLADTLDVMHNPDKAPGFLEKRLAAFNPAIVGEARRQLDPYMRYTSGLVDEVRARTPGLSDTLPFARDNWGRPRGYQTGMGTLYDALSPIASKLYKPEPIDAEAIKHDFNMGMPQWSLAFGGVRISTRSRPEVYSRYLELRGQVKPSEMGDSKDAKALIRKYGDAPLLPTLNAIVTGGHPLSDEYAEAGPGRDGGKDKMISRIVADYGRAARLKLLTEFDEVAGMAARKKEKKEASR